MYDNQVQIDGIERQMQQIAPELSISGYGIDGNKAVRLSLTLPVKGNRKVIKKLEELGWKKLYQQKVRTDNAYYTRCQYDGYIMHQTMQFNIQRRGHENYKKDKRNGYSALSYNRILFQ